MTEKTERQIWNGAFLRNVLATIVALGGAAGVVMALLVWLGADLPVRMSQHASDVNKIDDKIDRLADAVAKYIESQYQAQAAQAKRSIATGMRILQQDIDFIRNRIPEREIQLTMWERLFSTSTPDAIGHSNLQRQIIDLKHLLAEDREKLKQKEAEYRDLEAKFHDGTNPNTVVAPHGPAILPPPVEPLRLPLFPPYSR